MENTITQLAWCWRAPYLSLSINLAKTMHPTSVIPQEPVPPKAAPTHPTWQVALAGRSPAKVASALGTSPTPAHPYLCGPPTTGGPYAGVHSGITPLEHPAQVTGEECATELHRAFYIKKEGFPLFHGQEIKLT